jgi:hypothetical protein
MATKLKIGDVIMMQKGTRVYHNQSKELIDVKTDVVAVVEAVRDTAKGSEDDHFEDCFLVDARYLNADGTYHPEGALMTFA